eukprot:350888-Chlamydomonas_euryale.AAC.7
MAEINHHTGHAHANTFLSTKRLPLVCDLPPHTSDSFIPIHMIWNADMFPAGAGDHPTTSMTPAQAQSHTFLSTVTHTRSSTAHTFYAADSLEHTSANVQSRRSESSKSTDATLLKVFYWRALCQPSQLRQPAHQRTCASAKHRYALALAEASTSPFP